LELLNEAIPLLQRGIPHPADNMDTLLFRNGDDSDRDLSYCVANYSACQIGWVGDAMHGEAAPDTFDVFPPLFWSRRESEYWELVFQFPAHRHLNVRYTELTAILSWGCIDTMTAVNSNFPFNTEDCKKYMKIIRAFNRTVSSEQSPQYVVTSARLWRTITLYRFCNGHGTDHPILWAEDGIPGHLPGTNPPVIRVGRPRVPRVEPLRALLTAIKEAWTPLTTLGILSIYILYWSDLPSLMNEEGMKMLLCGVPAVYGTLEELEGTMQRVFHTSPEWLNLRVIKYTVAIDFLLYVSLLTRGIESLIPILLPILVAFYLLTQSEGEL